MAETPAPREEPTGTSAPVSKDSPLWIAWCAYILSEEYANAKRWAVHPEHAQGSLWAAFLAGYAAAPDAEKALDERTEAWAEIAATKLVLAISPNDTLSDNRLSTRAAYVIAAIRSEAKREI